MRQDKNNKKQQGKHLFIQGVLLLGGANMLVKIIGLLFKIPMSYYLGDEGMGYFNSAYQIYTWLYMLSTAGLPVAVSILISECRSRGERRRVRQIERTSAFLFLLLGTLGMAIMMLGARPLAAVIGTPDARYAIFALAPTLLFICLSSALRGYFQGFSHMGPPAVSQILEALGKLLVGVLLATYAIRAGHPLPIIAAYAVAGLAVGEAAGFFYLLFFRVLFRKREGLYIEEPHGREENSPVLSRLLRIALPITASSSVMSVVGLVDLMVVQRRLQTIGYTVSEATAFYGNYTTLAVPMFNLPPALIYPIATAALPLLSAAVAKGDRAGALHHMQAILRITSIVSMPCTLGLSLFARPILLLFFPEGMANAAAPLLSVLSLAVFFLSMLTVTNAALQANGHAGKPMISMLVGGAVKLLCSYALIGLPAVGTYGVPPGTLACYIAACGCNLYFLATRVQFFPSLRFVFFRPLLASVLSVGAAYALFVIAGDLAGSKLFSLLAIALAALFYLIFIFATRAVTEADLKILPFGRYLIRFLPRRVRE